MLNVFVFWWNTHDWLTHVRFMLSIRLFWSDKKFDDWNNEMKWKRAKNKPRPILIRHSKVFSEQLEVELTEWKQIPINTIAKPNKTKNNKQFFALHQNQKYEKKETKREKREAKLKQQRIVLKSDECKCCSVSVCDLEMMVWSEMYKKANYIQLNCSWAAV